MEKQTTKVCKHCQTEIPKKAKVCPQCRKKQGGIGKIILLVFVGFVLLGSCFGSSSDEETGTNNTVATNNSSAENTSQETEVVEIVYTSCNVDDMVTMLKENALKAEQTYQDQYLEITGRLSVIDSDGNYISLYPIKDEWAVMGVRCDIKNDEQLNKVLEMKIGDTVTLKGKIKDIGEILGYTLDIDSIN